MLHLLSDLLDQNTSQGLISGKPNGGDLQWTWPTNSQYQTGAQHLQTIQNGRVEICQEAYTQRLQNRIHTMSNRPREDSIQWLQKGIWKWSLCWRNHPAWRSLNVVCLWEKVRKVEATYMNHRHDPQQQESLVNNQKAQLGAKDTFQGRSCNAKWSCKPANLQRKASS